MIKEIQEIMDAYAAEELEPGAHLVTVTPDMAYEFLTKNIETNRKVRQSAVDKYADLMSRGEWSLSDSCIVFDTHGVLLNGQHRLRACVEAMVPFQAVLLFGVPRNAIHGMDRGMGRTTYDSFKMMGDFELGDLKMMQLVRSTATAAHSTTDRASLARSRSNFTDHQLKEFFDKNKDAFMLVSPFIHRTIKGVTRAPVGAAIVMAYYSVEPKILKDFMAILMNEYESTPRVVQLLVRFLYENGDRTEAFHKTQRAIKAFANGEDLSSLYSPPTTIYRLPPEKLIDSL